MITRTQLELDAINDQQARHAMVALSITQHKSTITRAQQRAQFEHERNSKTFEPVEVKAIHHEASTHGNYPDVTYRHIAQMFCAQMPVQGNEYAQAVESNLETIKALPVEAKHALKCAYIFSRKVPREEREDLFQDLMLNLLKARITDEKLCYSVARCDWADWWKRFKVRAHLSLDESVSTDDTGNPVTLADLLVNEIRFETMVDGKLDAEYIWARLPAHIKPIISKRLSGKALLANERQALSRFVRGQGNSLLIE